MPNEKKQITNAELANELSSKGFYVNKISRSNDTTDIDYLVVSVCPFKDVESPKSYSFLKSENGQYYYDGNLYNETEWKKIIVEKNLKFEFSEQTMNYEQHLIEVFVP